MAFGAVSAIFQQSLLNPIARGVAGTTGYPTGYLSQGLLADTVNVALMNNTGTPDKTVAFAALGYNTGQWTAASNEVIDSVGPGTNWAAGGRATSSKAWTVDSGSSSLCFQSGSVSGAGNVTITNAYGCLVYDNTVTAGTTVAKQGLCYNSFGGSAQGVTAGTFTVLFATVGALTNVVIFNITV